MGASRPFPASYDGECAECDGAIYEGDDIVMLDGEALHEDCAPEPPREPVTFAL